MHATDQLGAPGKGSITDIIYEKMLTVYRSLSPDRIKLGEIFRQPGI